MSLTSLRPFFQVQTRFRSTRVLTPALSGLPLSDEASAAVRRLQGSTVAGVAAGWPPAVSDAVGSGVVAALGVGSTTAVAATDEITGGALATPPLGDPL